MNNPLMQTIESLAKEKGIEPEVIIAAIEDAVLTASRKYYKSEEDLRTKFNAETGQVELYAVKTIVEEVTEPATQISLTEAQELYGDEAEVDMEIEFPKPTDVLGRIAAQTAKQVIFQKVREAERENVYAEYIQRIGEVVNGTVKRFENGDIVAEFGRIEAVLPRKEQSRAENYAVGDRVRAVIKAVNKNAKGPQIVLSRTDPALLIKLFEQEVPEIYDGTVVIRGAVREAGDRAKVAVFSRERDVDPVGACVGMKGTRVQSIIRELRGEKIDIVDFSEDPVSFVTNAISPAKVQRVSIIDDAERVMEVVVEDRQLSLAIGKKGQNVRLAAKLTGWKIDIKSEEEKRREVEAQFAGFEAAASDEVAVVVEGVDQAALDSISEAGFDTLERLAAASVEDVTSATGMDAQTAERIIAAARDVPTESTDAAEAPPAAEAEPAAGAEAATETAAETAADAGPAAEAEATVDAKPAAEAEATVDAKPAAEAAAAANAEPAADAEPVADADGGTDEAAADAEPVTTDGEK